MTLAEYEKATSEALDVLIAALHDETQLQRAGADRQALAMAERVTREAFERWEQVTRRREEICW